MFAYRDTRGPGPGGDGARGSGAVVEVAFTDSRTSFAELPDTDPGDLAARLAGLEAACGVPVVRMHQVHGGGVHVVGDQRSAEWPPPVDALVSRRPGLALMVRAADCVPVLLADPGAGVVGAAHAGRDGLVAHVVPATVTAMRSLGAETITAWVGPHVCGACYEVPGQLRADVAVVVPQAWAVTSWGTPALDLGAAVESQLRADGCEVVTVEGCTREDARWHSYRRDGAASGRFAGLVWIRS